MVLYYKRLQRMELRCSVAHRRATIGAGHCCIEFPRPHRIVICRPHRLKSFHPRCEEWTMSNGNLQVQVKAVQMDLEGLLKLLGGTADQREKFWEIIKGITSRQVVTVLETNLAHMASNLQATTISLKTIESNAK